MFVHSSSSSIWALNSKLSSMSPSAHGYINGSLDEAEALSLEYDVLVKLSAYEAHSHVSLTDRFWPHCQIKAAGAAPPVLPSTPTDTIWSSTATGKIMGEMNARVAVLSG